MELGVFNHQYAPKVSSANIRLAIVYPHFPVVGFQLNGEFHASGSSLSLSSIGEGESALLCVTDGSCCTPPNRSGEFYYPDNTRVGTEGSGDDFYRDRGNQMIRLHRRNDATSPTGMYKCAIPDSSGVTQEIFITLN
jgi:hypothetical protein